MRQGMLHRGCLIAPLLMSIALAPAAAAQSSWLGSSPTAQPETTALYPHDATIDGYRLAKFGMDERAVREAAARDFGVPPGWLIGQEAVAGGGSLLRLDLGALEPFDGPGAVAYHFDSAGKLDRVTLGFAAAGADRVRLVDAARIAASDFLQSGWALFSIVRGVRVGSEELIVFAGSDPDGRGVEVRLESVPFDYRTGSDLTAITPTRSTGQMTIAYIADRPVPRPEEILRK